MMKMRTFTLKNREQGEQFNNYKTPIYFGQTQELPMI